MRLFSRKHKLARKHVVVMGLGSKDGGVGTVLFLNRHGAYITVTDLRQEVTLQESLEKIKHVGAVYKLGFHDPEDFMHADMIIRNPGIKRDHPLLQQAMGKNIIVESPIGIFSELVKKPYIGITGTKGKTFTTSLVHHILEHAGLNAVAVGNNCVSPLRYVDSNLEFVVELSSWQLQELALHQKSPHIACWLNFFPDHLNYYSSLKEYWNDKSAITRFQHRHDFLVVPYEDKILRRVKTRAQKVFYTKKEKKAKFFSLGCFLKDNIIIVKQNKKYTDLLHLDELSCCIQVPHYRELLLAAVCCSFLYNVPLPAIRNAILDFKGIPHRFEHVFDFGNIRYINDSAATTPHSVICALQALHAYPVVLIMGGGHSKNLDLGMLYEHIEQSVDALVLFENDITSNIIFHDLQSKHKTIIHMAQDMRDAVHKGSLHLLEKGAGGIVLLSPSCSGAPFYQDLFVRGELFKKSVEEFMISYKK